MTPGTPRGRRRAAAPVALVAAALLAAACNGENAAATRRPEQAPVPVRLVPAATRELPRRLQVTGELAAFEELALGFEVAGRVLRLQPDVGDHVRKEGELAALDPTEFELVRERARAALAAARARLGLAQTDGVPAIDVEATAPVREAAAVLADAERERNRVRELVSQDLQAQAALDAAEAARAVAESRLQRARDEAHTWIADLELRSVELRQAQQRLDWTVLRAPWNGRVAARRTVAGSFTQVGTPVLTLLRTDPLRLRLRVPELQAGFVRPGQEVEFAVDGMGEATFRGTVARIGARIDEVTRTLLVEAEVENGDETLLPGGFCRASIVLAAAVPAVVVPKTAVQSFAGVDRVFVVADGKAAGLVVELGQELPDGVEVLAGLAAGRRIVADARDVRLGAPVVVAE